MKTTSNLGLMKPEGTDVVDIENFNTNADTLDTTIGAMSTVPTTAKNIAGAIKEIHTAMSNLDTTISDGEITTAKLADSAVTTAKLAANAVTGAKMANSTVTAAQLADGAVTSAKLADSGVVAGTYKSVTVDGKGRVTAGTNPTTLSGYGITDAAPLASPALTGTPTAPTAVVDTSSSQLATTAFVLGQAGSTAPAMNGTAAAGSSVKYARADHVHPTDTTRAPLASPALTGTPTAPTAVIGTNSKQLATTEYVDRAVSNVEAMAKASSNRMDKILSAKVSNLALNSTSIDVGGWVTTYPYSDSFSNGFIDDANGLFYPSEGVQLIAVRPDLGSYVTYSIYKNGAWFALGTTNATSGATTAVVDYASPGDYYHIKASSSSASTGNGLAMTVTKLN
ncbi:hypothetical protein EV294_10776 [Paenibacillus sp. BK033]|uniref:hypothetical protein n=1 Tax=Paenibacillus sp. BK033 TaxID=2512133 RepID=UPI0010469D22|nr:hypothetical protein [Paenibacillus sp. BK033]TCM93125.1 hypothetical protein EV294_10776 [Paenibacillus sp. BK033]